MPAEIGNHFLRSALSCVLCLFVFSLAVAGQIREVGLNCDLIQVNVVEPLLVGEISRAWFSDRECRFVFDTRQSKLLHFDIISHSSIKASKRDFQSDAFLLSWPDLQDRRLVKRTRLRKNFWNNAVLLSATVKSSKIGLFRKRTFNVSIIADDELDVLTIERLLRALEFDAVIKNRSGRVILTRNSAVRQFRENKNLVLGVLIHELTQGHLSMERFPEFGLQRSRSNSKTSAFGKAELFRTSGAGGAGRQRLAIALSEPGTIVTGKSQLRRSAAESQYFKNSTVEKAELFRTSSASSSVE